MQYKELVSIGGLNTEKIIDVLAGCVEKWGNEYISSDNRIVINNICIFNK